MRQWIFLGLLLASAGAAACEWDRDTLADEATLGHNYLAAITGRFPRNPPLYYAMRRDRILAERRKSLHDYDDLAVAYDKLGDPLSALRWIDRKPVGDADARYRTLANRGTFLVHAWLAGKASKADARRGLANLQQAVKLNSNAHFGREPVQIKLVQALLDPEHAVFESSGTDRKEAEREAEGYAGIVRLGAGWESPDVFRALAVSLGEAGLGAVATAAVDRAEELESRGIRPKLDPKEVFYLIENLQEEGALRADTKAQFDRLRREADAWQARRTAFMMARLRSGRHPDTDSTFWQGWTETPAPKIDSDIVRFEGMSMTTGARNKWVGFLLLGAALLLAAVGWAIRYVWRQDAKLRAS